MARLLATLLLLPPLCFAAPPIDGIYFCNVSESVGQVTNVYVSVNGQPDGRTIFAVAALQDVMPLYGYGIGQVSGFSFTGTTNFGLPFNMTIDGASITGQIALAGSRPVAASVSCAKI
jgi:hypothetical protein